MIVHDLNYIGKDSDKMMSELDSVVKSSKS